MTMREQDDWLLTTTERVIYDAGGVHDERVRAHEKHRNHSMEAWPTLSPERYLILAEEVGEVAKEFNEAKAEGREVDAAALRKELIQVAAMAVAWAAALRFGTIPQTTDPAPMEEQR